MIKGKYIHFIITLLFIFSPMVVRASTIAEQQNALLETAMAFYRQDSAVQYDSYRQMAEATPEDASKQHYIYTDCSTFIYQIYKQSLGIDVPTNTFYLAEYANKYQNNSIIINLNAQGSGSSFNNANILNEISKWLNNNQGFTWQTGDLLVFRRYDDTGHVMMIDASDYGNIKLIESGYDTNGGWYDANSQTDKVESRSISITNLNTRLQTMLNYTGNNRIKQLSVIRYITNGSTYYNTNGKQVSYNLTTSGQVRNKYKGLSVTKEAKETNVDVVLSDNFAVPGSTISYEITIKNNSNTDYYNVTVTEEKDSKVSFSYTGGGSISGNKITWHIPLISKGSTYTLNYMVAIENKDSLLGKVITSKGNIEGLPLRTIHTNILNALSTEKAEYIRNAYDIYKNDSTKDLAFINKIYKQAFDYDLSSLVNLDIYDFLSINHCSKTSVCTAQITNATIKNMTVSNFYGLRVTPYNYKNTSGVNTISENLISAGLGWDMFSDEESGRARSLNVSDLQTGDIILVKKSTSRSKDTKAYLYLGNKELVRNIGGAIENISGNTLDSFLRNLVGENYIILRPAIMMNKSYVKAVQSSSNVPQMNQSPVKKPTTSSNNINNNLVNDGIENPDCGDNIPLGIIGILIGMLLVIGFVLRPNRLYKIN